MYMFFSIRLGDLQGDKRSSEQICTIESAGNIGIGQHADCSSGQNLVSCLHRQNFMAASEIPYFGPVLKENCVYNLVKSHNASQHAH